MLINRDKYNLFSGQQRSAAVTEALIICSVLPNAAGNGPRVVFQTGVSGAAINVS